MVVHKWCKFDDRRLHFAVQCLPRRTTRAMAMARPSSRRGGGARSTRVLRCDRLDAHSGDPDHAGLLHRGDPARAAPHSPGLGRVCRAVSPSGTFLPGRANWYIVSAAMTGKSPEVAPVRGRSARSVTGARDPGRAPRGRSSAGNRHCRPGDDMDLDRRETFRTPARCRAVAN